MNTAALLRERNVPVRPESILCVVLDGEGCITHTEATLDIWWANLSPEQKAEIYENDLDREALTPTLLPVVDSLQAQLRTTMAEFGKIARRIALTPDDAVKVLTAVEELVPKERLADAVI